MNKSIILEEAEKYARSIVNKDGGGHDWHHIQRVHKMAVRIAKAEKIDAFLPAMMALLHELHDRKIVGYGNEEKGLQTTKRWLKKQNIPPEQINEIMQVIENQSFSSSGLQRKKLASLSGQIMQDADRLDAIGAIGIARCFAYNGKRGNPIHDPAIEPRKKLSAKEYKEDKDTSINHFYEKLLKLKELMNTRAGKQIANRRHQYMVNFLKQFISEWEGKL